MPLQHRHEYAAGFPRGFPTATIKTASESPRQGCALRSQPISARSELVELLRSVDAGFYSYAFSSCLPDPDRLTVPIRPVVVRAARTLPRASQGQAALSFGGPLRQTNGGALSSPLGLMAPRGAR